MEINGLLSVGLVILSSVGGVCFKAMELQKTELLWGVFIYKNIRAVAMAFIFI
ncbi:hypothetical protein AB1D63_004538 [Escherichia coli]|nr:hypothetical protein [Escherichia coli]EGF1765404.1 hypothetical protein [Escherichia coli]EJA1727376.1 hypothetical protein [Escherichia coli]MCN7210786.1 hypothetical protein [Escherichia coli]HCD6813836.1 hypothetical protein [Escherichia coli]